MPRANRYFLPGHVWHLTHRCHEREFLLKFARDRATYLHWLFEARKRHGLCVLNYVVTSNHVHLLVRDKGEGEFARSMQLIAGRTGQQYNARKARHGAFWQDRYHATAMNEHLHRCLVYIDLNMVRAGVVEHSAKWEHAGCREIQNPPERYSIIDLATVSALCGFTDLSRFQAAHRKWVDETLANHLAPRNDDWSQSIAVGTPTFVESAKAALGVGALHRQVESSESGHTLRESVPNYEADLGGENSHLKEENTFIWNELEDITIA
jgi:putative transposase